MNAKTGLLIVGAAGATASAQTGLWTGANHPNGNVPPQAYGLRLDNFGGDNPATFSFENLGQAPITIELVEDNGMGMAELTISGTISGNSASGGTDFGFFTLDVTYTGSISGSIAGNDYLFTATGSDSFSGTITGLATEAASPVANGESFNLATRLRGDATFYFGLNIPGARIPSQTNPELDPWEGQGWLSSPFSSGTQDFLFTAIPTVVPPSPGTAAALAMGGFVAARRRR